jgi:hypothetical protein
MTFRTKYLPCVFARKKRAHGLTDCASLSRHVRVGAGEEIVIMRSAERSPLALAQKEDFCLDRQVR